MITVYVFSNGTFVLQEHLKYLRNSKHLTCHNIDDFFEPILDLYVETQHVLGTDLFRKQIEKFAYRVKTDQTLTLIKNHFEKCLELNDGYPGV